LIDTWERIWPNRQAARVYATAVLNKQARVYSTAMLNKQARVYATAVLNKQASVYYATAVFNACTFDLLLLLTIVYAHAVRRLFVSPSRHRCRIFKIRSRASGATVRSGGQAQYGEL
jgi:hypothetical protein